MKTILLGLVLSCVACGGAVDGSFGGPSSGDDGSPGFAGASADEPTNEDTGEPNLAGAAGAGGSPDSVDGATQPACQIVDVVLRPGGCVVLREDVLVVNRRDYVWMFQVCGPARECTNEDLTPLGN